MYEGPFAHGAAHPRVSGENSVATTSHSARYGSSPRERGKLPVYFEVDLV